MEENKYNLDNTKNCISDGNNTLIITYDKDDVLHPRKDQYNHCHLIPLTSRLRTDLDDIESITDALKNLITDAHLDCGVLGLEEDAIEHKPEWCFNEILNAYNKELEDGEIQNSTFNQLVICPLWLYKHSGVSLNTYRQDRWDSSFVGIAYITKEEVQEMMMDKDAYNMHEELVTFFEKNIQWELNELNQYFNGEVYASYLYQKKQLVQDEHNLYYPNLNAIKEMYLNDSNLESGVTFDLNNLQEFEETMDIDKFDINAFKYENYGQNEVEIYGDNAGWYASIEQKDNILGNVYTAIISTEYPNVLSIFKGTDVSEFTQENMVLTKKKSELNSTQLDVYNKLNDSLMSWVEKMPCREKSQYYVMQKQNREGIKNFKEPCNNINYKNLGNKNHTNKSKEEKGQEK
ncbi:MAG: hypothetical protein JTJ21_07955 [Holdemanella sp.]|nr:hypothetical protein [Holdemanella sp.]